MNDHRRAHARGHSSFDEKTRHGLRKGERTDGAAGARQAEVGMRTRQAARQDTGDERKAHATRKPSLRCPCYTRLCVCVWSNVAGDVRMAVSCVQRGKETQTYRGLLWIYFGKTLLLLSALRRGRRTGDLACKEGTPKSVCVVWCSGAMLLVFVTSSFSSPLHFMSLIRRFIPR